MSRLRPSLLVAALFAVPLIAAAKPKQGAELPFPDAPEPAPKPLPKPPSKPPVKPEQQPQPPPIEPEQQPQPPPIKPVPSPLPDTLDPGDLAGCTAPANCPPGDVDLDGIPDAWEDRLAARFAPELRLPPASEDWTRPASVDWYLARVHMRFEHSGCSDCQVLGVGAVTQDNLASQSHRGKNWRCAHKDGPSFSSASAKFFLQPPDDGVHKGAPQSAWRAYVHVKRDGAGWAVQYWFFYAYNDSVASANHEGDWEHITVITDAAGEFAAAHYAQHEGGRTYQAGDLEFVAGTHPVVWVADGSHASYPKRGSFDIPNVPAFDDHTYAGGPVWQTWHSWVNVGEKGRPRGGQRFIDYGGRWGEFGLTSFTSGPRTPSFQDAWDSR